MKFGKAYELDNNKRQFRQRLNLVLDVRIDIPETHEWRVFDINLGGAGIGIPLLYKEGEDPKAVIARNCFSLDAEAGDVVKISVPENRLFAEGFEAMIKILHIQTTSVWYGTPMLYFMGCSFADLNNKQFWQLEKAFMRAKKNLEDYIDD